MGIDEPLAMPTCAQVLWAAILFSHNLATQRTSWRTFLVTALIQTWIFGHSLDVTLTLSMDVVLGLE